MTALLALAAGVGLAVAPATAAHAAPIACSYRYSITSIWSGGFVADLVIQNDGAAWSGWVAEFDFTAGEQISSLWNGNWRQGSAHVTIANLAWNANVNTGQTVSLGFVASQPRLPDALFHFTVNGVPCVLTNPLRIIVVEPIDFLVPENGLASYTVRLSAPPTSTVMVNVYAHSSGDPDIRPSANFIVFTPANWNIPQRLYVMAQDDPDTVNGWAGIVHSASSGSGYGITTASATEIDDD